MKKNIPLAAFCMISKNVLPAARTLLASFKKYHPEAECFVLFHDENDINLDFSKEIFSVIPLEKIEIPNKNELLFKYNITDLNTAIKPYFIEYLFKNYKIEKLLYFDSDIVIFSRLTELIEKLDNNNIVLIPHITESLAPDDKIPNEIDFLRVGAYNLGFIGLKRSFETNRFVKWWQKRLYEYAVPFVKEGLFRDQKWIDLVPSLFEKTYILRHPGYDVAYWNLNSRGKLLIKKQNKFYIGLYPLRFFHFSGYAPEKENILSKHQNRYSFKDFNNILKELFNIYGKSLIKNGYFQFKNYKYYYNYFDNGVPISDIMRYTYWKLKEERKIYGNPFNTKTKNSFYNWLLSPINYDLKINNLLNEYYNTNPELKQFFPKLNISNQDQFIMWFEREIKIALNIDDVFLPKVDKLSYQAIKYKVLLIKSDYFVSLKNFLKKIVGQKIWQYYRKKYFHYLLIKKRNALFKNSIANNKENQQKLLLNISGYLDTESGVGESARGFIRAINFDNFINSNLNNINQEWLRKSVNTYSNQFTKKHDGSINLICVNADQVKNVITNHLGIGYIQNKYNIGYWYWESNIFPNELKEAFQFFDEIWVASDFVYNSLNRISPIPIIKIPPSFDKKEIENTITKNSTKKIKTLLKKYNVDINKDFIFLNIFDSFSFIERKNPMAVITSFKKAFREKNNVKLIIKTVNLSKSQEGKNFFEHFIENDKRIVLIDKYLSYADLLNLINISNAYISLHRAEGLGIPIIEAMIMKKPVIVTGYGGNMDFCNVNNSYIVKWDPYILDKKIGLYPKGTLWADAKVDNATEYMFKVFNNKTEAQKIGEKASFNIENLFSPKVINQKINERIKIVNNLI